MDRIGEYLVSRQIGEGGMGKVYEAAERLSGRKVALKVLRPELARAEDGRRLFLNEMTILAHLDHPNVVRCLACTEVDGQLVMVLELLEGPTLRQVLEERGRLPWPEAVGYVTQMAAGLHAAHLQEPAIIHRDLKPENVIVSEDRKTLKVTDFGIAKVLEALSRTTTHSVGTLQYMSPEQIDAAPLDARADLYALGVVFYELLAGRPPFESASPRELLNQHCTQPPPPLPEDVRGALPKGVERLLFSLLEKRPGDRPATAAQVVGQLEPFTASETTALAPTRAPSPTTVPATAKRPVEPPVAVAVANDTIGLIEQAAAPRTIANRVAVPLIVLMSALAFGVAYVGGLSVSTADPVVEAGR